MAGYARTDTLRFASGGTVRRGWQATLERYQRGYPDRAAMGTLSFDRLDITPLSDGWALVFGAWRLTRADDAPHGLFTLVLRRTDDGWRIVHDHTSSGT
jgi:ketosteroid isomerase-like protein